VALPRKNRISNKKEIDHIFKNGRTVKGSFLFIRFLNNQKGYSRFAFIAPSKHVPLAVDRSKIKRIFSGEIRKTPLLLKLGYDIIVVIHRKVERKQFGKLAEELRGVLLKIS